MLTVEIAIQLQWGPLIVTHLSHFPVFSLLYFETLGENCALASNQSLDCRATTLFTIDLNSANVWNTGFNWLVFRSEYTRNLLKFGNLVQWDIPTMCLNLISDGSDHLFHVLSISSNEQFGQRSNLLGASLNIWALRSQHHLPLYFLPDRNVSD